MTRELLALRATFDEAYWMVRGDGSEALVGYLPGSEAFILTTTGARRLEAEIDRVVYELYGLGEAVIAIIEGGV